MADTQYYWQDKENRAALAQQHTEQMQREHAKEIEQSVAGTIMYTAHTVFSKPVRNEDMQLIFAPMGSVEAAFKFHYGKTAILNFASYTNPGGGFLKGSRAQEECLCHDSFLYNVLSNFQSYYDFNTTAKNRGLYTNRALYSPDIRFHQPGNNIHCDVITCAAPNLLPAKKYGLNVTAEENTKALTSRINFILNMASHNHVDTLILGAYGCGVFCQDPTEVATLFKAALEKTHHCFKTVIFAVPEDVHSHNHEIFKKIIYDC